MKHVQTHDGSHTFFSEKAGEHYHSLSGAESEAVGKYVHPLEPVSHVRNHNLRVLDVCFGLGYNSAAIIDAVWEDDHTTHIDLYAVENDETILGHVQDVHPSFLSYPIIRSLAKDKKYTGPHLKGKVYVDDLRKVLGEFKDIDIICFDPFSPKKNPELWTQKVFEMCYAALRPGGALATYSCARSVRNAMVAAGFQVFDTTPVGRRAPGTLARKIE